MLGVLDITAPCLVTQVEATVPNGQQVGIQLLAAADDVCTATPTFKSDPKPDYISTITSFLKPAAVFATKSSTATEIVKQPKQQRLSLPPAASGTMTVAIACKPKPDAQPPQDSKAPQTRTVVVHYKDPPQFSASAGTLVSLYGKHVFGVTTSQTGVNSSPVLPPPRTPFRWASPTCSWFPSGSSTPTSPAQTAFIWPCRPAWASTPTAARTRWSTSSVRHHIPWNLLRARAAHCPAPPSSGRRALAGTSVMPFRVTPPVNYRATYRFAFAISYSPPIKGGS